MRFTRREVHGPIQRTAEDYRGIVSPQLKVAHAPEFDDLMRALANGIQPPIESEHWTPMERAVWKLKTLDAIRSDFIRDGSKEAVEIEAAVRAGRQPAAAAVPSEQDRLAAAKAALTGAGESK